MKNIANSVRFNADIYTVNIAGETLLYEGCYSSYWQRGEPLYRYMATGNTLTIRFVTNERGNATGFVLKYIDVVQAKVPSTSTKTPTTVTQEPATTSTPTIIVDPKQSAEVKTGTSWLFIWPLFSRFSIQINPLFTLFNANLVCE